MRVFAVIAHKFNGDINLNDLPGSGRVDVIARCINSSIFLSHDIRRDIIFSFFAPKIQIRMRIDSSRVKYLNPDERSTAALIKNAILRLKKREETSPGFFSKNMSFDDFLEELKEMGDIYYLHEDGEDIRNVEISENPVFLLSDSVNLSEEEEMKIEEIAEKKISVSPKVILASHAITIVNNELDRRGL